jgi:hypothetical protein
MTEMSTSGNVKGDTPSTVSSSVYSRESLPGMPVDHEDDKERIIAKAALSIAELGELIA